MTSPINYFSSQYYAFLAGETSLQNKSRKNQVCEVSLIPGLKLFHFREYGPMDLNIRYFLDITDDVLLFVNTQTYHTADPVTILG